MKVNLYSAIEASFFVMNYEEDTIDMESVNVYGLKTLKMLILTAYKCNKALINIPDSLQEDYKLLLKAIREGTIS